MYEVVIISAVQQRDSVTRVHNPVSFRCFSHTDHRILGRVLCALQQVPVGRSFHRPQGASAHPKPPVHPSPQHPIPFGNYVCFQSLWVCVSSAKKFICILLPNSTYKWYHIKFFNLPRWSWGAAKFECSSNFLRSFSCLSPLNSSPLRSMTSPPTCSCLHSAIMNFYEV